MKRVLLSASQFKLSDPGYDVSTATEAQLTLDAFAASGAFNGVYLAGRGGVSALNANTTQGVINFGKTFSAIPQAWVKVLSADGNSLLRDWENQKASSGDSTNVSWTVTQSTLTVSCNYSGSTFCPTSPLATSSSNIEVVS